MRRWALGSFIGSAAWHFGWEIVRAWLYEQGFHVVNPYLFGINLGALLHYGVTVALVGLGFWLFWKTRPQPHDRTRNDKVETVISDGPPRPLSSQEEESLYMTAEEVVHYMANDSEWGVRQKEAVTERGMRKIPLLETFAEFKRVAEEGKISALGRLRGIGTHTTIPSTFWLTSTLDMNTFVRRQTNQTAPAVPDQRGIPVYTDLKILRADIYKAWGPRAVSETSKVGPSIDRIPCTELLLMATAFGWDFASLNSLHLLDLQDAMRQGGRDGTLTIWGRLNKWSRAESLMRKELLEKIEPDHWAEFFVHLFAARDGDNFNVYSWAGRPVRGAQFGDRGYVDLHVERVQATSWLQRDAAAFKGRTKPR